MTPEVRHNKLDIGIIIEYLVFILIFLVSLKHKIMVSNVLVHLLKRNVGDAFAVTVYLSKLDLTLLIFRLSDIGTP